MKYNDLEQLKNTIGEGYVCLFGAGLIGCTWAYDLLKAMGFHIDFYCDNNKKENIVIKDGIKTISLETLYSLKDNVLVFITVGSKYQSSIRAQLENNGIYNIIRTDHFFMQSFIESLIEVNDQNINDQFRFILDDAEYLRRQFEYRLGYQLNLDKPQTFNEKLQWLKLYDRNPEYVQMVDKYEVKKYVTDKIGEEYIIPTLGIYDSFDEIEFEKFPQQFVLKCTHDSGSVAICKDKRIFNWEEARGKLESSLRRNFYWIGREWPYKTVKPRIIAEKYMTDESGDELKDYKIFNFNGKPKLIQVDYNRFVEHKRILYGIDWKPIEAVFKYESDVGKTIVRPAQFDKMLELAGILSEELSFVRTDFYLIDNRIYFGELTFYPEAGFGWFNPESFDSRLGEWIDLPRGGGEYS